MAGDHHRRSMQLVEKSLLVRITDCLLAKFCNLDGYSANHLTLLLNAVETLLLIGHLWPGSEHMGSEIGGLQQVLPFSNHLYVH